MTRTCDELGVCNGRHCHDVAACPDYDLIACNSCSCQEQDDFYPTCPHAVFECEVPCSPEPAVPTPPFAPGVIQHYPKRPYLSVSDSVLLVLIMVGSCAIMGTLIGYLVEPYV